MENRDPQTEEKAMKNDEPVAKLVEPLDFSKIPVQALDAALAGYMPYKCITREEAEALYRGTPMADPQAENSHAEKWMRQHKDILPGPLTDTDWDQLRGLLVAYAEARNEAAPPQGTPAPETCPAEQPPDFDGWERYWASLDKDSQERLASSGGLDGARAWFGIGAVWGHSTVAAHLKRD